MGDVKQNNLCKLFITETVYTAVWLTSRVHHLFQPINSCWKLCISIKLFLGLDVRLYYCKLLWVSVIPVSEINNFLQLRSRFVCWFIERPFCQRKIISASALVFLQSFYLIFRDLRALTSRGQTTSTYSYFEKGCRKKCTRQSWKVLWVALSSLILKEFERMAREAMDVCLQVLKESNKSRFDGYSVRNSVLIISHITFRDCRVNIYSVNLFEIAV